MANNPGMDTQISTSDIAPVAPAPAPPVATPAPAPPVATPAPPVQPVLSTPQAAPNPLYGPAGPEPEGTEQGATTNERVEGVGVEGETIIWEARYSMRNFFGRAILLGIFAVAWVAMAIYAFGSEAHSGWRIPTWVAGAVVLVFALGLLRRVILARYGHYYRLTNRRLFVSTGLFNRRRDQMELLRVKDVYTRQSFAQRMLSLGSVVVVSTEQHFPMLYLTGVDDPKGVMDLIWHHARAERDERSSKIDAV